MCPRSTEKIKSNLHQKAKKTYTEKARDHQRTSGDPPSKPLSEDQERIVDIYDTLVNHALKTLWLVVKVYETFVQPAAGFESIFLLTGT